MYQTANLVLLYFFEKILSLFFAIKKKKRQIAFNVPWTNREVARDTIKTSDFSKKTSSGLEGTLG